MGVENSLFCVWDNGSLSLGERLAKKILNKKWEEDLDLNNTIEMGIRFRISSKSALSLHFHFKIYVLPKHVCFLQTCRLFEI